MGSTCHCCRLVSLTCPQWRHHSRTQNRLLRSRLKSHQHPPLIRAPPHRTTSSGGFYPPFSLLPCWRVLWEIVQAAATLIKYLYSKCNPSRQALRSCKWKVIWLRFHFTRSGREPLFYENKLIFGAVDNSICRQNVICQPDYVIAFSAERDSVQAINKEAVEKKTWRRPPPAHTHTVTVAWP